MELTMSFVRSWRGAAMAAALVPLVAVPRLARAQAFQLNDIGSCALARAYANTGAPCKDASQIYWNPGAPTELSGFSLYGGASAISVVGSFIADTSGHKYKSNEPLSVPPAIFVNYTFGLGDHHLAVGFGVYVPYGLISQWRSDFPGRFESQRASLTTLYMQPNIAFDLVPGKLSIGAGPVISRSNVRLDRGLDLSQQTVEPGVTFAQLGIAPGTEFGTLTAKAAGTGYGFNAGLHFTPTHDWEFGARFLSKLVIDYSGTATFKQVPTGLTLAAGNPLGLPGGTPVDAVLAPLFASSLATQGVTTSIPNPWQAEVGIGYNGISRTVIDVDYEFASWSAFGELPLDFQGGASATNRELIENYHDSWSIRVGLEHQFGSTPMGITGRAGFSYINSPVPDGTVTPLLPDMNRYNFAVGLGLPISRMLALDAGYVHVGTEGRRGRTEEKSTLVNPDVPGAALNDGYYNLAANVYSLSLRLHAF
jgi:long-chain fatty acid transport protein